MTAGVRVIDFVPGGELILYAVQHQCLCGAQNCPYYVVRLSTKAKPPLLVFKTYGIDVRAAGRTGAITDLVVDMHDSALVTDETRYIYAYGKYQPLRSERIRNTDHARKRDGIAVLFRAGSVVGTASRHRVARVVRLLRVRRRERAAAARRRRSLEREDYADAVRPRWKRGRWLACWFAVGVAGGGRYQLHVDVSDEEDVPYALTLAIR